MDKVFVFGSFSRILYLIARGEVTEEMLAAGLFVFGCRRIHAFQPGTGEVDERTMMQPPLDAYRAHTDLVAALKAAEASGRCTWWRDSVPEMDAGEAMDELLRARGLGLEDCDWTHGGSVGWRLEDFLQEEADRLGLLKLLLEEAEKLEELQLQG